MPAPIVIDGRERRFQQTTWGGDRAPIAEIAPGARIRLRLPDSSSGQLTERSTRADLGRLDFERVDAAIGPIAVAGAKVGDRLDVRIRALRTARWGWSGVFASFGLLRGRFEDDLQLWTIRGGTASPRGGFLPKVQIPTRPMLGWVGVAPRSGRHSMIPPRRTGGNLDHRAVGVGSVLSLPVEVDGALLSFGDPHAVQGDGEVCGTGIETSAEVEIEVRIAPGAAPRMPFLTAPRPAGSPGPVVASLGVGPKLETAAVLALEGLLERMAERGVQPKSAYLLVSVAGELRISEAVDMPNYVVSASFPGRLLPSGTNVKGGRRSARPRKAQR